MKYGSYLKYKYGTQSRLVNKIPDGSTVLDVGCAQGYLAEYLLKKLGCMVYGIELEKQAAEKAKKFCQDIKVGDIEKIVDDGHLWNVRFDRILIADVLEHLKDPEKVLIKLKTYLKPNGVFLISLPNIAYLPVRLELLFGKFEYAPTGILDCTHLKFFTRQSMNRMFKRCGLNIIEQKGVGHLSMKLGKTGSILDQLLPTFSAIQFMTVASKINKSK